MTFSRHSIFVSSLPRLGSPGRRHHNLRAGAIAAVRYLGELKTPDSFPRFPPLEPSEAESSFEVQDGFRMELIASEPLITDPVAMAYDEKWAGLCRRDERLSLHRQETTCPVCGQHHRRTIGRVRLLEDTDGDGRFDKSTVFVEGLSWPSGIVCSRGGVYITATPDVWYCKDNDGDGRSDEKRKVLTGFRKFNVQAIMNNPIWGLDQKLYVAGSSNGGNIGPEGQEKRVSWRGDFRFDPKNEIFEPQNGERSIR